jgi:hypothetical protein
MEYNFSNWERKHSIFIVLKIIMTSLKDDAQARGSCVNKMEDLHCSVETPRSNKHFELGALVWAKVDQEQRSWPGTGTSISFSIALHHAVLRRLTIFVRLHL